MQFFLLCFVARYPIHHICYFLFTVLRGVSHLRTPKQLKCIEFLKTVDTINNCQRPVFSLGVSQHIHKITNLWKFELNRPSKLRDNNERKNTLVTRSCVLFRWLISRPEILNLRSQNQIRGKILLSRKLSLQREPFLTMFYTINLSLLLITK